jgi:hypothetical protein
MVAIAFPVMWSWSPFRASVHSSLPPCLGSVHCRPESCSVLTCWFPYLLHTMLSHICKLFSLLSICLAASSSLSGVLGTNGVTKLKILGQTIFPHPVWVLPPGLEYTSRFTENWAMVETPREMQYATISICSQIIHNVFRKSKT